VSEPKRDSTADSELTPISQQRAGSQLPRLQPRAASRSTGPASSALTELDAPSFEDPRAPQPQAAENYDPEAGTNAVSGVRPIELTPAQSEQPPAAGMPSPSLVSSLAALSEADAIPDSDASALEQASESLSAPKPAAEPNITTRSLTHVSEDMWLDSLLDQPVGEPDPRQRLAWRFKAAFTAWKMLLPVCSAQTARVQLVNEMRRYERLLRDSGPTPQRSGEKQLSDALHLQLSESKTVELERALSELEALLLAADASISQEAFKARWNREHTDLRQLLRYARLLACRRFGIGYRRDRFEALALELLTLKLPSGRLQLMQRRRASQVLRQLLRGLYRPATNNDDNNQAIAYLREALDKLDAITDAKQFFDSGLYLDVYGYKISRHDRILSPEFLYLSVAFEVDIHNLLLSWGQTSASESGRPFSLAPVQLQLRAQKEAAQAVFHDFHKPLAGSAAPPKVVENKRPRNHTAPQAKAAPRAPSKLPRYLAAGLFALTALGANLYVTDSIQFRHPPRMLSQSVLQTMSPLIVSGRLSADGKRLSGSVSRPNWLRLSASERGRAAEQIASELKRRGIEHAQLLAYKDTAIEIDYGSVVFVDAAQTVTRSHGQ
jgi:hypothetical protein